MLSRHTVIIHFLGRLQSEFVLQYQGDDLVHGRSLLGYQLLTSSKQRTTTIGYLGLDYARVLA